MEENTEITPNTAKEVRGVPFKKGEDPRRNTDGRPKGSLDFKTKFNKFLEKIAKDNEMELEDVDQQLFAVAFKKAKDGDYAFWRDIHDRLYDKPVSRQEVTGKDGEALKITFDDSFKDK